MNANTAQSTRYYHPEPSPEVERAAAVGGRRALCAEAVAAYRTAWRRVRTLREPPQEPPPVARTEPRYAYRTQNGRWQAYAWHEGRKLSLGTYATEGEARAVSLRRLAELKARGTDA